MRLTLYIVTEKRLLKASKVKKAMPKGGDAVVNNKSDDVQYPCIVRAVYRKNKISTIVNRFLFLLISIIGTHCFIDCTRRL